MKRFVFEEYELTYQKINKKFYYDLLEWLYSQNYSTSYVGTHIKILKTMMEAASEFSFHNNREYTKKHFKKPAAEIDNIFLDQTELKRIHQKTFISTQDNHFE